MKHNKKGFISMTLVYSLLIVFLFLVLSIIVVYGRKISYLETIENKVQEDLKTTVSNFTDDIFSNYLINNYKSAGLSIVNHEPVGIQNYTTTDYRYQGKNPNNYIRFNNSLWRIIGVFQVDNGSGVIEYRIKIVGNEIGDYYLLWNTASSNNWNNSSLKNLLNSGDYYNITNATYTDGCKNYSNVAVTCNFASYSLDSASKTYIDNAKWYLGYASNNKTTESYISERTGSLFWTGKVGLMYPSDYGYASNSCSTGNTLLSQYNSTTCKDSNWLYNVIPNWSISPSATGTGYVYGMSADGTVNGGFYIPSNTALAVRPTIYLKHNVKYDSGYGTKLSPYIIK